MTVSKTQVLDALRRVKGPDLESNLVELGLVSEVLIKDGRVYFSITVQPERAAELEPMRQAAEKIISALPGVAGVTAVLTAEAKSGGASRANGGAPQGGTVHEHPRVKEARAQGAAGDGGPKLAPRPAPAGGGGF